MRHRLLALDIDGTLMDSGDNLRDDVREGVRRASEAGLDIVLCTGRRYRTARPVLSALGIGGAVILHNGVIVKDVASGDTIQSHYLEIDLYHRALELIREAGPPLVYVDAFHEDFDIFCQPSDQCHEFQVEYLEDNRPVIRTVDTLEPPPTDALVMICSMAEEALLEPVRDAIEAAFGGAVRTNLIMNKKYRGHMLEIVSARASKWSALEQLARERGIAPEEIIAIGDDRNDAEMVERAGLGIAMANAVPEVKAVADEITGSNAEGGVARALERLGF